MKLRPIWIFIVLVAVVAGAALFLREKTIRPPAASTASPTTEQAIGAFSPATTDFRVPMPKPNLVEIQDGKTIDFSSGLPIIKDSEKEKAALDRAVKEMEAAVAEISFGSPAPAEKK